MKLELDSCDQSAKWIDSTLKPLLFKNVYLASQERSVMRLSGLGVGAASALLIVASRVSKIAEAIFKGALNIFGCPFFENCRFSTGLRLLTIDLSINVICLPFSLIHAALDIIDKTVFMGINPAGHSYKCWIDCDPQEKAQYDRRVAADRERQETEQARRSEEKQAAQVQDAKNNFLQIKSNLEADPNNLELILNLANLYLQGIGTDKDENQGFLLLRNAVSLGSDQAAVQYSSLLDMSHGLVTNEIIEMYEQGAENGSLEAMHQLGKIYISDTHQNNAEAIKWLTKAVNNNHQPSEVYLWVLSDVLSNSTKYHDIIIRNYQSAQDEEHRQALSNILHHPHGENPNLKKAEEDYNLYLTFKPIIEKRELFKKEILKSVLEHNESKNNYPQHADSNPELAETLDPLVAQGINNGLEEIIRAFSQIYQKNPKEAFEALRRENPEIDFSLALQLPIFQ